MKLDLRQRFMACGILRVAIYLASAVLIFLGFVFVVSVNLGLVYFLAGLVFFAFAGFLLFLSREKKPIEIKQTMTVTGPLETKQLRCPNCGALIDPTKTEVHDGKPFVTCAYCGNKVELTEEPTW